MEQSSPEQKSLTILDEFKKDATNSTIGVLTRFFQPSTFLSQKKIKLVWNISKYSCIFLLVIYFFVFGNISAILASMLFGVIIGAINAMANSNKKNLQSPTFFSLFLWIAVFIANIFEFSIQMQVWLAVASIPSGIFGYYWIYVKEFE
jgi:hypothetical protein